MRIALGIEYDGSRFCGWQTQPSGCAAQDQLEQRIQELGLGLLGPAGAIDEGDGALAIDLARHECCVRVSGFRDPDSAGARSRPASGGD